MLARPIRFTAHLPAFRDLLIALGGTPVVEEDGWVVLTLDSGCVALHAASDEKPSGTNALGFEVPDLDAFVGAAVAAGVEVAVTQEGHGRSAVVRAADGLVFTVEAADPRIAPTPDAETGLSVMPLWYTADTDGARAVLAGIGARPRIGSNQGVWFDFTCDQGGLVAVHAVESTSAALSFEYDGDLDALADQLRGRDIDARIIDENYSRVLLVSDPDGGTHLWINGRQRDLYGYTAAPGAPGVLPG